MRYLYLRKLFPMDFAIRCRAECTYGIAVISSPISARKPYIIMFYVPINTDEGWFIISFICYPRDTAKIEFSHTQDFIIESDEKSSTEFIETLSNDIKYDDLCELGYNGTVIFDSSKGQYSGRVGLEVLYVFKDGMAIYISFNTSVIYNIFKL